MKKRGSFAVLLICVQETEGWLTSDWELTYRVGWEQICKAVHTIYDFYIRPEVLMDKKPVSISSKDEILKLRETWNLTIRGVSTLVKAPVQMVFTNQTNAVQIDVAKATEEFKHADYEKFNFSMCHYADSIELAMYR